MATRSKTLALYSVNLVANGSTTAYTVPANRRTIIRTVQLAMVNGVATTYREQTFRGGVLNNVRTLTIAAPGQDLFEFWRVLEAGDQLRYLNTSGVTVNLTLWLSGAELVV